jgi:serine protease Do
MMVTVLVLPGLALAEDKPKKKSYIGVQIAVGKEPGTVLVQAVIDNAPAAKGGLKGGDIILRIDGAKPADLATTVKVITSLKAGKKAKFLIERDGKEKELEIIPAELGE